MLSSARRGGKRGRFLTRNIFGEITNKKGKGKRGDKRSRYK